MSGDRPLRVAPDLLIPAREIRVAWARSGGPGGQNVNKVATKAVVRFSVADSPSLDEAAKRRLRKALAARLSISGEIVIHADRYRDRTRNLEDARARLAALLSKGLQAPKPRRPTRPTRASVTRRLESKRRRSHVKRDRRGEES